MLLYGVRVSGVNKYYQSRRISGASPLLSVSSSAPPHSTEGSVPADRKIINYVAPLLKSIAIDTRRKYSTHSTLDSPLARAQFASHGLSAHGGRQHSSSQQCQQQHSIVCHMYDV